MLTRLAIPAASAVLPARSFPGALLSNGSLSELMAGLAAETGRDFPPCSPEFPAERAGILERGVLDETLSTRDMAVEAALRAVALAEQRVEDVRCVIVSSVTPDMTFPAISTTVHAHLGCRSDAIAFDVSIGCNGFLVALDLAARHLEGTPVGTAAVVVASETMVRVADATNRVTLPLFGDGAGAVVLRREREGRLRSVRIATLGDCGPRIELRANGSAHPVHRIVARDGALATDTERVAQHCIELEGKRVFRDTRDGELRRGDLALLCGFGSGYSIGALLLEW